MIDEKNVEGKYGRSVPTRTGAVESAKHHSYTKDVARVLRDFTEEEKEKYRKTPFCEACDSKDCGFDKATRGCPFHLCERDELIRRMVKYADTASEFNENNHDEFDEMYDRLYAAAHSVYNVNAIDVYAVWAHNQVCPKCDGSGVTVGLDIESCGYCDGSGLISRKLKPGFHYAYCAFTRRASYIGFNCFGEDEKPMIEMVNHHNEMAEKFNVGSKQEYVSLILSDRLKGADLGYVSSGGDSEVGETLVVINAETNKIIMTGDWQTIHELYGVDQFMDIEFVTSGKAIVETLTNYNSKYHTMTNDFADRLFSQMFANIVTDAITHASYGGVENLVAKYTEKYQSIQDIIANITKHLELKVAETYVVSGEYGRIIHKIIDDFAMIGMTISQADAATIINLSSLTTEEYITVANIMDHSAVGIFLVEYILLMGEYAELTEGD